MYVVLVYVSYRMSANLSAERKQFEEEREELHSTYDRQQEVHQLHDVS